MKYQPETTHTHGEPCGFGHEYAIINGVWKFYDTASGSWNETANDLDFLNKTLVPINNVDCKTKVIDSLGSIELNKESDPNGINQHEEGAKLDNGKVIAASVLGMFANALYAVTEVGTFGANKYTEGGWQHVQDGEKRYANAGMRHFLKRNIGEEIDQDSELPHLAHEAWNKLAELELYLRSKKGQ